MPPQFLGNPQDNMFVSDDWGDEGNFEIIADDDWISLPNVAVIVDRVHLLNETESDGDHFSDDTGWIETDDDDNDPDYEDIYPEYDESYPDYEDYDPMEASETLNEDLPNESNSPAFYGIYDDDISTDEVIDDVDVCFDGDIPDDVDDDDYYDYDLVFNPLTEAIVTTDNPKTTNPTTETNSSISSTESSSSSISKAESSSNILTIAESNESNDLTIAQSNSNSLVIKEGNTD